MCISISNDVQYVREKRSIREKNGIESFISIFLLAEILSKMIKNQLHSLHMNIKIFIIIQ